MKRAFIVIGAIVGLMVVWNFVSKKIPSHIEYRGQEIKLSRYYLDYEEYKDDPDNIDPSETSRVQHLVAGAPIANTFETRKAMFDAAFSIKFPGYGFGGFGDGGNSPLTGFSIEIPRADKFRYITFQRADGKYVLVDEFTAPEIPLITRVRLEGNTLVYSSDHATGEVVRPLQVAAKADSR